MAVYPGAEFLPERPVGAAIVRAAVEPDALILCVTAPGMQDAERQIDYYVSLATPDPRQRRDAARRVAVASLADDSRRWLSVKVREDAAFVDGLRAWVDARLAENRNPLLRAFEPSADLEALAGDLGIGLDQAPAATIPLGSKAASRALFVEAGVPVAPGSHEQRDIDELVAAMVPLVRAGTRRFMLKLSSGLYASGLGIARLDLSEPPPGPDEKIARHVREALPHALVPAALGDWTAFAEAVPLAGVVAEERLVGQELTSPSFQGVLTPDGPRCLATHEQVLAGGQVYSGSSFPAAADYRARLIEHGLRVGQALHRRGITRGDYGVDFIAIRDGADWRLYGCELNLRSTGVKHGFVLATTLLDAQPDADGTLHRQGEPRVYLASDTVTGPGYTSLRPAQVIDAVTASALHFTHQTGCGVVLYMLSALAYGKLGALAIGPDPQACERMVDELRRLLDGLVTDGPAPAATPPR
jgi:PGM1 C-terminal domain